jgi:hypothetical protein
MIGEGLGTCRTTERRTRRCQRLDHRKGEIGDDTATANGGSGGRTPPPMARGTAPMRGGTLGSVHEEWRLVRRATDGKSRETRDGYDGGSLPEAETRR